MEGKRGLRDVTLNDAANFFVEYELRELGAVDSKECFGCLDLNGEIYEPRADYYVMIKKSMPRT